MNLRKFAKIALIQLEVKLNANLLKNDYIQLFIHKFLCYFYEYDFTFCLLQPFNLTLACSISTSTSLLQSPLLINKNGLLLYMGSQPGNSSGDFRVSDGIRTIDWQTQTVGILII